MREKFAPSGAVFSPCRRYRLRLGRQLAGHGPTIAFCLHNPSTANEVVDDPTSRRGIDFAIAWDAGRLVFVNAWAGIATRPADLWSMSDPIGPGNDEHIVAAAQEATRSGGFVVMAWGAVKPPGAQREAVFERLAAVEDMVRAVCPDVRSLGVTAAGHPRHPLYRRSDARPVPYRRRSLLDRT